MVRGSVFLSVPDGLLFLQFIFIRVHPRLVLHCGVIDILTICDKSIRWILPSLLTTTTQPFSTITRRTVLIDLSISVPSAVSITKRGPTSGSCSAGCSAVGRGCARRDVLRLVDVVSAGFSSGVAAVSVSVFGFAASVVSVAGGRERERRPVVRRGVRVGVEVLSGSEAAGVSVVGLDSGDGSGVGTAATSCGGGSGSLMRAPTDDTRLPFCGDAVLAISDSLGCVAESANGLWGNASNEPPKVTR